jgi:hypothetical protein
MNKTIKIIIGIIVVVIVIGGIWYKVNKKQVSIMEKTLTQDKTATWKVYINTKARFIFKYPPDWGIIKEYSGEAGVNGIKDLLSYFINTVKAQTIPLPDGWEIVKEGYYVTPAGAKANTYTVILAPSGYQIQGDDINKPSEPIIVINERQFNCYGKEWWTSDGQHIDLIYVDSPNFRWLPPFVKYTTPEGDEKITGLNYIATCSKDPKVLRQYNQ